MPLLRVRLEQQNETVQLLEAALGDRFGAGQKLVAAGEWDAAIYLLGYVAEMVLKTAYLRVQSIPLTALVDTLLPSARQSGTALIPRVKDESYHSLLFWAELLLEVRRQQGRALAVQFEIPFINCYRRLYHNWWVEMRYHSSQATEQEAREVLEDVSWILTNRVSLWS